MLVLVTSLCWGAVRDLQAHQTPPPWEKLPNPGFRCVLVFTHQLWFLGPSNLGGNWRELHALRAQLPSEVGVLGPAAREVPPQQRLLSWEQVAEVNVALGVPAQELLPALGLLWGRRAQLPGTFRGKGPCSASSGLALSPFLAGCGRGDANRLSPGARATSALVTLQVLEGRWASLGQQGLVYLSYKRCPGLESLPSPSGSQPLALWPTHCSDAKCILI